MSIVQYRESHYVTVLDMYGWNRKTENLHCICNHSIGLIILYITSLTKYLTYSNSLPQVVTKMVPKDQWPFTSYSSWTAEDLRRKWCFFSYRSWKRKFKIYLTWHHCVEWSFKKYTRTINDGPVAQWFEHRAVTREVERSRVRLRPDQHSGS